MQNIFFFISLGNSPHNSYNVWGKLVKMLPKCAHDTPGFMWNKLLENVQGAKFSAVKTLLHNCTADLNIKQF